MPTPISSPTAPECRYVLDHRKTHTPTRPRTTPWSSPASPPSSKRRSRKSTFRPGAIALPDSEYQACSPAHCAAGATTTTDGRRMSINVEVIGGSIIVEHYVEEIAQPDHLRLISTVGSLHADWPHQDRGDLGPQRQTDQRRIVRVDEHGPQLRHARDARFPGEARSCVRRLPRRTSAPFRGPQPPRDTSLCQEHRTARIEPGLAGRTLKLLCSFARNAQPDSSQTRQPRPR